MNYVQVGLTSLDVLVPPPQSGQITIAEDLALESTTAIPVDRQSVMSLVVSPLSQIFAEGMRNPDPKMKYISWFVVIEELEQLFTFDPLFSSAEVSQITAAVPLSKAQENRLRGLMGGRGVTVLGRAEKLYDILSTNGMGSVKNISGSTALTLATCQQLIRQRNLVAHKGTAIDTGLLYNILFPLAIEALAYIEQRPRPVRI